MEWLQTTHKRVGKGLLTLTQWSAEYFASKDDTVNERKALNRESLEVRGKKGEEVNRKRKKEKRGNQKEKQKTIVTDRAKKKERDRKVRINGAKEKKQEKKS